MLYFESKNERHLIELDGQVAWGLLQHRLDILGDFKLYILFK